MIDACQKYVVVYKEILNQIESFLVKTIRELLRDVDIINYKNKK